MPRGPGFHRRTWHNGALPCLTGFPPMPRFAFLLMPLLAATATAGGPSLEDRLAPLAGAHKGHVAIAVKNLNTGESSALRADEPMPTASLIKFPVMIEAYRQAEEG